MPSHSLGSSRLVEACAKPGCPVCRCVRDDAVRHLGTVIYEHVTDPDIRRSLRASRGFCGWHAGLLADVPDSGFGSAIIAADVLAAEVARAQHAVAALGSGPRRSGPLRRLLRGGRRARPSRARSGGSACPGCRAGRESERRYLDALLESAGDARFDRALERSDGLCVPHVDRLIEVGGGAPALVPLLTRTVAQWRLLLEALRGFVDKHDHRSRSPITQIEARSWRLALELLAGTPGVFGSDLAGRGVASPDDARALRRENERLRGELAALRAARR